MISSWTEGCLTQASLESKRKQNEKKFRSWTELPSGGRRYSCEVQGRFGWKAKYLKEVNSDEITLSFWQEIYNEAGALVEIQRKFPVDLGHKEASQGEDR